MKQRHLHIAHVRPQEAAKQCSDKILAGLLTGLAIAALMISAMIAPVQAQENMRLGPDDNIPEFELIDQYGSYQSLKSLSGENGLILAFIRSVDWSSYCQNQVFNLAAYEEKFDKIGYGVAAISFDSPLIVRSFGDSYGMEMPVLSDTDSKTIKAFGLLDIRYPETSDYFGAPYPALYVINPEGTVTHVFAEEDYKKRPNLNTVLSTLTHDQENNAAQSAQAINASAGPKDAP